MCGLGTRWLDFCQRRRHQRWYFGNSGIRMGNRVSLTLEFVVGLPEASEGSWEDFIEQL